MDFSNFEFTLNGEPWLNDSRGNDTTQLDWTMVGEPWWAGIGVTLGSGHIKSINGIEWEHIKSYNGVEQSHIKTALGIEG